MILGLTSKILVIDAETTSPVDLDKEGQYRYWEDPGTRTLMLSCKQYAPWGHPEHPTELVDFETRTGGDVFRRLREDASQPPAGVMFAAANCEFDRAALKSRGVDTPPEKWLDVLVLAYFLGFAGRLNSVLQQTKLQMEKKPEGTRLITLFSRKGTSWREAPHEWQKFRDYCIQDTHVEERLLSRVLQKLDTPPRRRIVRRLYGQELIYRRVNRRGLPIDQPAVASALAIRNGAVARALQELEDLTGLDNPNSRDQLLGWLREQGALLPNLQKATVESCLSLPETPPRVQRALQLRQMLGKTSVAKFDALRRATSSDGRLRGGWQFYGASRTGRVAGRVLNPANLARPAIEHPEEIARWLHAGLSDIHDLETLFPEKEPLATLSSALRACICAPRGQKLVVADLTSIESCGGAWLSGCKTITHLFETGRDSYRAFAALAFGIPYENVSKIQRTFAKPAVLGACYGMSGYGLMLYAKSMGVDMTENEAQQQVDLFRATYHEIPHYWRRLESAAFDALHAPGRTFTVRPVARVTCPWGDERIYEYGDHPAVSYRYDGDFLFCTLPSGRFLAYFQPEIDLDHTFTLRDGRRITKPSLAYRGINQDATGPFWQRIHTRGAKLYENVVQALCRDVEWHGNEQLTAQEPRDGLRLLGDVYDELITEARAGDKTALERLIGYMTLRPPWMGEGFFLAAGGYEAERYRKD